MDFNLSSLWAIYDFSLSILYTIFVTEQAMKVYDSTLIIVRTLKKCMNGPDIYQPRRECD